MDKSNAQQVTQTHIGGLFIPNSLIGLAISLHLSHALNMHAHLCDFNVAIHVCTLYMLSLVIVFYSCFIILCCTSSCPLSLYIFHACITRTLSLMEISATVV